MEALADHRLENLLANIPPGTCKSLLISVFFPAWVWTKRPDKRFMYSSYADELSLRDSLKCRSIVESEWYQRRWGNRVQLLRGQNTKGKFENSAGGWRIATSVGGRGTGEHPDFVMADDPHNVKQSESDAERQAVLDWWDGTMSTRGVVRKARRCVVMQRLHQNDLSGHLLKKGGWTHFCLPMEAEPDVAKTTELGFKDPRQTPGELLWPEAFTKESVESLKKQMGSYRAAGQLQQRPAPRGGGMFKREWFEIVKAAPATGKAVRRWDFAATKPAPGKEPDWTCGLKMRRSQEGVFYIEDVRRTQSSAYTVMQLVKNTASQDGVAVVVAIPQDPGQAGKGQAEDYVRQLVGYVVKAERETGSKEVRAEPFSVQCEAGNVKLVDGPWVQAFLDELEVFPLGSNDDQVDCGSGALLQLANLPRPVSVAKVVGGS